MKKVPRVIKTGDWVRVQLGRWFDEGQALGVVTGFEGIGQEAYAMVQFDPSSGPQRIRHDRIVEVRRR